MHNPDVRTLFDSIAHRYDFLNHLLSGGIDRYWRAYAIGRLRAIVPKAILDVATGTGDLAIAALTLEPAFIIGVDVAEKMLELGQKKVADRGLQQRIRFQWAEAEHLPFNDGHFDATMVAFGARNFGNLEQGLGEMFRVTRRGGMIMVLEFSLPRAFPFKQIYLAYFRNILPLIGKRISGSSHAYRYLPETVMRFPEGEAFCSLLRTTGYTQVAEERLTGGIVSVYTGIR